MQKRTDLSAPDLGRGLFVNEHRTTVVVGDLPPPTDGEKTDEVLLLLPTFLGNNFPEVKNTHKNSKKVSCFL